MIESTDMRDETLWGIITFLAVALGFYAAFYIRSHKKSGTKMLCPLDSDCETVVRSDYSKIFGIPLENLGLSYYAAVGLVTLTKLAMPDALPIFITQILLLATIAAFGFSIYLTGIQLFKIKEWCAWCLVSALMCLIIFLGTIVSVPYH